MRAFGGNMKLKFKIYKHIGDISHPNNGWTKELNYVSWDDREPDRIKLSDL